MLIILVRIERCSNIIHMFWQEVVRNYTFGIINTIPFYQELNNKMGSHCHRDGINEMKVPKLCALLVASLHS